MLHCFGISRRSRPQWTTEGQGRTPGQVADEREAGSSHNAWQKRSTSSQEELKTHTLRTSAADTQTASSDLAKPLPFTKPDTNTTPAAATATHRASDGAAQAHLHSLILPQTSIPSGAPRDPHSGADRGHTAEGAQHSSTLRHAQLSSDLKAEGAQHNGAPPTPPAMLDPCSRLTQAVSKVLASASVRQQQQQQQQHSSRQGVETLPHQHDATPAVHTACHTVTLASLEQASRSQAPDTPLALLVLGCHHGSGKPWQLFNGDRAERTTATILLRDQIRDSAMALNSAVMQGSSGAQSEEGIVRGLSSGLNAITDASPSTDLQVCMGEMESCVWLNDAFSKRLGAPSKQAALATTNQSISSNLTIQRHIVGFCRNMELGKQDPVCFWSMFNPTAGSAQVERICMWPCELLANGGARTSQQGAGCRAILISIAECVSKDMQYEVLLQQHMAYQFTPCMVTVLSTEGCILTQNAESVAWLGCRSKEHSSISPAAGGLVPPRMLRQSKETSSDPSQPFYYLKELFYNQEDLLIEMLKVVGDQEPFVERMEIRSPLLRAWLGAGEDEEVWHRVHIVQIVDPITQQPQFCLSQMDVTDVIQAEQHVLQLQQQQSALLKEILPQQVVERLLMQRSDLVNSVSKSLRPKANPAAVPPCVQTPHRKPPAPSTLKGELGQTLRPSLFGMQHGVQGMECEFKPLENAQRISRSSSTRRAMRSLQDLTNEDPVSRSMTSRAQDRQPLQGRTTSLDGLRFSLTHGSGQQQLGLEQGPPSVKSYHSSQPPSHASFLSPRVSGSDWPFHRSQPGQDATPGMIWLTQQDVMDLAIFHDNVTILFADIKGFTSMVNQLHPSQVMLFLNSLYSVWDSLLETFGVYKVETIGDCYMCCTGLFCYDETTGTKRLGGHDPQHARTMLEFAKAMVWSSQAIKTPLGDTVQVRVGIHSGPCSSGVVGQRMPRWCLFGDTVNTANRMESNGVPGCIHASEATVKLLEGEPWKSTGGIVAKGKGLMQTSLLPVLPGAAHAAALSIAQRQSASSTTDAVGESTSASQSGNIAGEAPTSSSPLHRSMTGLLSSASGAPHYPAKSVVPRGAEFVRMATAAAAALTAAAAAINVPERHCQSCPGQSPGAQLSRRQLPGAQPSSIQVHNRPEQSPEHDSLLPEGECSAILRGGRHTPLSVIPGSSAGEPSPGVPALPSPVVTLLRGKTSSSNGAPPGMPAQQIIPEPSASIGYVRPGTSEPPPLPLPPASLSHHGKSPQPSTAAQLASTDPNTSQPSSPPLPPASSLSHCPCNSPDASSRVEYCRNSDGLCKSGDAGATGHGSGQGAWPTYEQGRPPLQQGHTAVEQEQIALTEGHTALGQGCDVLTRGGPVEQGLAALTQGQTAVEQGYSKEPEQGRTTGPKEGHTTVLKEGHTTEPKEGHTTEPEEGHTTEPKKGYTTEQNKGHSLRQGAQPAMSHADQATCLPWDGGGVGEPCHASESRAGSSSAAPNLGGCGSTIRGDSLDLDVRLLSSLYVPTLVPRPCDLQQQQGQQTQGQQQGQQQQQQQQGQQAQPPLLRHHFAHSPTYPVGSSMPEASKQQAGTACSSDQNHRSITTLCESSSDQNHRSITTLCESSSDQNRRGSLLTPFENSSNNRGSSPALLGGSSKGEGEGLASIMDGCQKLVDTVTSKVLRQLQESRPEAQARHSQPIRYGPFGPWASRKSLDLCSLEQHSSPAHSGKLVGSNLAREPEGTAGRRDRNGSLSLDMPRPPSVLALPRQVSQPSPREPMYRG